MTYIDNTPPWITKEPMGWPKPEAQPWDQLIRPEIGHPVSQPCQTVIRTASEERVAELEERVKELEEKLAKLAKKIESEQLNAVEKSVQDYATQMGVKIKFVREDG